MRSAEVHHAEMAVRNAEDNVRDAQAALDAAASKLEFATTFEKAPAPGVFRKFDARVSFDPAPSQRGWPSP
jgi:multidrug resistance efflux pump